MTELLKDDLNTAPADPTRRIRIAGVVDTHLSAAARSTWIRVAPRKVGLFGISLFLFTLAIVFMKEGAYDLAQLVRNQFSVTHPTNGLGFGWLSAYLVMSGSPVAASALTFLDAGAIDKFSAFAMITGSRLGASFIVLFIGFIHFLRGRDRVASLSMGLLSLIVTGTTYLLGLAVGLLLLRGRWLDAVQWQSGALFSEVTARVFDPISELSLVLFPRWSLFLVGVVVIMLSFSLFDRCLPQVSIKQSQLGRISSLVYKPWVMFLLGAGVTLISMSVSVSLSILVPLSQRGFVRRENVIPYIMGANITTFVDTLFAAVLLNNLEAFTVVLAEILSITSVSLIILALCYRVYESAMLKMVNGIMDNNRILTIFMVTILITPIVLFLL